MPRFVVKRTLRNEKTRIEFAAVISDEAGVGHGPTMSLYVTNLTIASSTLVTAGLIGRVQIDVISIVPFANPKIYGYGLWKRGGMRL